jgi:hypothetical protein
MELDLVDMVFQLTGGAMALPILMGVINWVRR